MFHIHFSIKNYFKNKSKSQKDYVLYNKHLFGNKYLEIQLSHWGQISDIFSVTLNTAITGEDHAGIRFHLDILGYGFIFNIYDNRHWDYENHTWEKYDENIDYRDITG